MEVLQATSVKTPYWSTAFFASLKLEKKNKKGRKSLLYKGVMQQSVTYHHSKGVCMCMDIPDIQYLRQL